MINEDIIAQLGFTSLDDYIGDPSDDDKYAYPELIRKSREYWRKYSDKNDFNAYIKIFTLFDLSFFRQLDQLLPARVNKMTGVLIQPNLLERNKQSVLPNIKRFDQTYETVLDDTNPNILANNILYSVTLEDTKLKISSTTDNYTSSVNINQSRTIDASVNLDYILYLTASADSKYNGTIYNYTYLYYTGTGSRSGTSPYWLREAVIEPIINSAESENLYVRGSFLTGSAAIAALATYGTSTYGSSTYGLAGLYTTAKLARVQTYIPAGVANHKYNGSKMTSRDFNVDSRDTIDGGPVVEWNVSNGNQLIYQNLGNNGSFQAIPRKLPEE